MKAVLRRGTYMCARSLTFVVKVLGKPQKVHGPLVTGSEQEADFLLASKDGRK